MYIILICWNKLYFHNISIYPVFSVSSAGWVSFSPNPWSRTSRNSRSSCCSTAGCRCETFINQSKVAYNHLNTDINMGSRMNIEAHCKGCEHDLSTDQTRMIPVRPSNVAAQVVCFRWPPVSREPLTFYCDGEVLVLSCLCLWWIWAREAVITCDLMKGKISTRWQIMKNSVKYGCICPIAAAHKALMNHMSHTFTFIPSSLFLQDFFSSFSFRFLLSENSDENNIIPVRSRLLTLVNAIVNKLAIFLSIY